MPKRIFRYGFVTVTLVSLAIYALAALLIPGDALIIILNGIFTGLVVAVTIVFFPLFMRAIKTKEFDRVSQLTIGIICTWFSLIISRSMSVAVHTMNDPSIVLKSPLVAFAAYIAIIGGILHITAPGMIESKLRYNKALLATAFAIGLTVGIVAIMWQGVPLL